MDVNIQAPRSGAVCKKDGVCGMSDVWEAFFAALDDNLDGGAHISREDWCAIFRLLDGLFAGARKHLFGNKARLRAWCLSLDRYGAESIKEALLAHARRSRFVPEVSEVVKCIAEETPTQATQAARDVDRLAWVEKYM